MAGWRSAMFIFNRHAASAGRDIFAEAAATMKCCSAAAQPVTIFAAGWTIVCRPTSGFWRSVQSILLREREVELGYLRDRRRPRRGGSSPAALATGALGGGRRETAVPQSAYRRIVEPRRPAAAGYSRNQRANRTPGVPASGAGSFILAA